MKKIIAIALSSVMLFALCIPAFAADKAIDSTDSLPRPDGYNKGIVKTTYTNTDYSYSVTFPATTSIAWNDTATKDISYSVDCQLLVGASLKVMVQNASILAPDTTGTIAMANTSTAVTDTLNLTASNLNKEEIFKGALQNKTPTSPITVNIPNFANVAVGDYQAEFTYVVTYEAPPSTTP